MLKNKQTINGACGTVDRTFLTSAVIFIKIQESKIQILVEIFWKQNQKNGWRQEFKMRKLKKRKEREKQKNKTT